jgi:hypothetical protein
LDPHHVVKRSAGGADTDDGVVILCRFACHRQSDAAYRNGKLLVSPLGGGRFCFKLVQAPNKWSPGVTLVHDHSPTADWLAAQRRPPKTPDPEALAACQHG